MSKETNRVQRTTNPGDNTRRAIAQLQLLSARIIVEFKAEPCPEHQRELRPATIAFLQTAVAMAVKDAQKLTETLPSGALATLDKGIADLYVLEAAETLLQLDSFDVKEKIIALVKGLLPLLPGKYKVYGQILELLLDLIVALQKSKDD